MSETICINKKLWDQTRELSAERKTKLEALVDVAIDQNKTIHDQRNELAAQRRTIATLQARKRNSGGDSILDGLDSYRFWDKAAWKDVCNARIAAIRNFGSLPGEPAMPMTWNDGACSVEFSPNTGEWFGWNKHERIGPGWCEHKCIGPFTGYWEARHAADEELRKLGSLP